MIAIGQCLLTVGLSNRPKHANKRCETSAANHVCQAKTTTYCGLFLCAPTGRVSHSLRDRYFRSTRRADGRRRAIGGEIQGGNSPPRRGSGIECGSTTRRPPPDRGGE